MMIVWCACDISGSAAIRDDWCQVAPCEASMRRQMVFLAVKIAA